jgi:hypothetical protein
VADLAYATWHFFVVRGREIEVHSSSKARGPGPPVRISWPGRFVAWQGYQRGISEGSTIATWERKN